MQRLLRVIASVGCVMALLLATAVTAGAAKTMQTPTTGQPGASANPPHTCGSSFPSTPGNSVSAQGSPFNPNGQAGNVYAGNPGTASVNHANSSAAVSQYDIACR
jgi:hypothetical protein